MGAWGLNWDSMRSDGAVMSLVTATTSFATTVRELIDEMQVLGVDASDDAFELTRAAIDVDGFLTDDELAAFIIAFGEFRPELDSQNPSQLRAAEAFRGARRFLQQPSAAFEQALRLDRTDGRRRAGHYVELASELLRSIAALDGHVSNVELNSIDAHRAMLLDRIAAAGPTARPTVAPTPPATGVDAVLAELHEMVGLDEVKHRVRQLVDLLRIRALRAVHGLANPDLTHHMAFVGNPGTGKTTVARLIGAIHRELGLLERGHVVEVDRATLVAGYVGQTAAKVDAVVQSARGGVLLIDEAYSLARGTDGYGAEALDAIVKRMEDHRDEMLVILTGYPDEMSTLLEMNPGLSSRIGRTIEFPDFDASELTAIVRLFLNGADYRLSDEAAVAVAELVAGVERGPTFGNGRWARQQFDDMVLRHAARVAPLAAPSVEQLSTLTAGDVLADGATDSDHGVA